MTRTLSLLAIVAAAVLTLGACRNDPGPPKNPRFPVEAQEAPMSSPPSVTDLKVIAQRNGWQKIERCDGTLLFVRGDFRIDLTPARGRDVVEQAFLSTHYRACLTPHAETVMSWLEEKEARRVA